MSDSKESMKKGERTALITTIATFLLAVFKGIAGFLSGSVALITDAVHSGADLVPIIASWFGLRISQKDPNEKFPYGYYKAESLTTLFVSIFLIYIAIEFVLEGYSKLFVISTISYPVAAGLVALSSAVISVFIARYQKRVGKEIDSQSLIANSKETLADVFSSCIVLIAIILAHYRVPHAEGVATIIISIFIFKSGLEFFIDSLQSLMDISPGDKVEEDVKKILNEIPEVENFKDLRSRRSGPFVFGDATVEIKGFLDIKRAHEIADKIEDKVTEKVKRLETFIVHVEPVEKTEVNISIPVETDEGLDSKLSNQFGRAKYFLITTINQKEKEIINFKTIKNEYRNTENKAGHHAAHKLVNEGINDVLTKKIGEISYHTLRDHLTGIYKIKGKNTKQAIESYMNKELEKIKKPTKEESKKEK